MGCPAPKISSAGSGAALMRNPQLCGEIVNAVVKVSNVPVTVKIRKGWDDDSVNAVEVAKICEQAGAAAITVHGRNGCRKRQMTELKLLTEAETSLASTLSRKGSKASRRHSAATPPTWPDSRRR